MLMVVIASLYCALHKRSQLLPSGIKLHILLTRNYFVEPLGSAAPKVATKMIDLTEEPSNNTVTLLCPAQAFPVPIFR